MLASLNIENFQDVKRLTVIQKNSYVIIAHQRDNMEFTIDAGKVARMYHQYQKGIFSTNKK